MSFKTLTYSPAVQGWPSFYSYDPDWMIGMNNYFYSFKGGNLYRHNSNNARNTFYEQWCLQNIPQLNPFSPTTLKSVINDLPLENKLFKTMDLVGDAPWAATMTTDLQYSGFIDQNWFEKKEATWFAFVRNSGSGALNPMSPPEYPLRSVNGIGNSTSVIFGVGTAQINFSITPLIAIGSIISIGDILYFSVPAIIPGTFDAVGAGTVINVVQNYAAGDNYIIIDTTPTPIPFTPIPSQTEYFLFSKNSVAESHGVLGHYCLFELSNNYATKVELFATESELMKSFP
jgi:hypothetical protein